MSLSRFRPGLTSLLVLGGLAAALLVGGCATPKDEEDARYGSLIGMVVDINGAPIAGASVSVIDRASSSGIGTLNYFGDRGPFITDSRGRFFIEGVMVQPNDTVVLNLRASKAGYIPSVASRTTTSAITVAGRTIPAGAQTPDIVVNDLVVADAVATLQGVGNTAQIGTSGGSVTAGVPNPLGGSLGNATISFPPGALAQPTAISITPLTGVTLPGGTSIAAGSPSQVLGPGQTVIAQTPLAAIDLQPDGLTFPAGSEPTITMPIPLTLPAGTIVPILVFSPTTGAWTFETNATVQTGGTTIAFKVSHFSGRMAAITTTWTMGSLSSALETVVFPPIATLPDGYVAPTRLEQSLVFPGATALESAFLANSFGAITHQEANGFAPVTVPAGNQTGVSCTRHTASMTVVVNLPTGTTLTRTGTRTLWICNVVPLAPVATVPSHLQGHIQGVATGN